DEQVIMAAPITTGIHPSLAVLPIIILVVLATNGVWTEAAPGLFTILFVAGVAVNYYGTKPKRLVLTDRRLLTCSVGVFGTVTGVERSDPFGAVALDAVRPGFPVGTMVVRYAEGRALTARVPRLFWPLANELRNRLPLVPIVPPRPD